MQSSLGNLQKCHSFMINIDHQTFDHQTFEQGINALHHSSSEGSIPLKRFSWIWLVQKIDDIELILHLINRFPQRNNSKTDNAIGERMYPQMTCDSNTRVQFHETFLSRKYCLKFCFAQQKFSRALRHNNANLEFGLVTFFC